MTLRFDKYEGLGNDFIVVDGEAAGLLSSCAAVTVAALCERRFGVGADGVLLVLPPARAESKAAMRVINADGTVPEMCGNGLRCVALHLARGAGLHEGALRIDTDAGVRACEIACTGDRGNVLVDMGVVRVGGRFSLDVGGEIVSVVPADVGNPHAVLLGEFSDRDIARLGPRISADAAFPGGANVEFARLGPAGIDLVVWERGVGLTLACGTGACAAAAVARSQGLCRPDEPVEVRLPGGPLGITVALDGHVLMRGPATHVFSGTTRFPA